MDRPRLKTKKQIEKALDDIFIRFHSRRYFEAKMVLEEDFSCKQKKRGRPGTQYIKAKKEKWSFEAMPNATKIAEVAAAVGMFPLITNIGTDTLLS